jgi:subtilisin family serine protease
MKKKIFAIIFLMSFGIFLINSSLVNSSKLSSLNSKIDIGLNKSEYILFCEGKNCNNLDIPLRKLDSKIYGASLNDREVSNLQKNKDLKIYRQREYSLFLQDATRIINASSTWNEKFNNFNLTGLGESICIIDTGANYSHPDLGGGYGPGHKILGGTDVVYGPFGYDFDDGQGHGTHVAGIAAANGSIKGVAPGASLVIIAAYTYSTSVFYTEDLILGLDECINNASRYNISVISMSLGGSQNNTFCDSDDPALSAKIQEAINKNISVVIATGNTGGGYSNATAGISNPACFQNVTRVGAMNKDDSYASYGFRNSNFADTLFAPGTTINSTYNNLGYTVMSGTSMSTPQVAGAIAIINQYLKLKGMTKTPRQIEELLNSTGKQIYDSYSGRYFSRIDIYSAIRAICSDNIVNSSLERLNNLSLCRANDTILYNFSYIKYDANNCGFTNNITSYTIDEVACDFCTPNWTAVRTDSNIWYNDTNRCYETTNLSSDLLGKPLNVSLLIQDNKTEILDNETNNSVLIELNFNLSNSNNSLASLNISKQNESSNFSFVIIRGLNLTANDSWTKAVYLENILDSSLFCLRDSEEVSIGNFSERCNQTGEVLLKCPGVNGSYSCADNGTKFKIDGLRNSGIREIAQFCGDGICNSSLSESCSSCSVDCGNCPSENPRSSGGGRGGGGATVTTLTESQLELGLSKKFVIGEKINFILNSENHSLQLNKILNDSANLTLRSEIDNFEISVGKEKKFNLTSVEYYDFYIKLENVSKNYANISLKKIDEKIASQKSEQNKSESEKTIQNIEQYENRINEFYKLIMGIIIIILLMALAVVLKRKVFYSQKSKR